MKYNVLIMNSFSRVCHLCMLWANMFLQLLRSHSTPNLAIYVFTYFIMSVFCDRNPVRRQTRDKAVMNQQAGRIFLLLSCVVSMFKYTNQ